MAEVSHDDLTNCSVCFELYAENGDHVPRILPCFHTFCEKCIQQLFRGRLLTCPECRITHSAGNVKKISTKQICSDTHQTKTPRTRRKGGFSKRCDDVRKNILTRRRVFIARILPVRRQYVQFAS